MNDIDVYGQNPFFYAVSMGHLSAVQLLHSNGSTYDHIDENGQSPLYYAIKSNKLDLIEFLLQLSCNIQQVDKRGMTPINFAIRHNKGHLKELLVKYGATPPADNKSKKLQAVKPSIIAQPKQKVNERLIPKEYVLQILDNGQYRPITDEEFDLLKKELPDIGKLFDDEQAIEQMQVPQIDESAPIQYHWEKVSKRMMTHLMKFPKAWIFLNPVEPEALGISDYFDIISNPMDFGTIKENLQHHKYLSMQHFLQDVELVFSNCILYNGEASQVSQMCREVQDEYNKQCEQLNVGFYITDTDA